MNEIIAKLNQIYIKGITLSTSTKLNTPLFTDKPAITPDSEDNLQRGIFTLQSIAKNFGIDISPVKPEMMAFLGQDPIQCKIIVGNRCVQQEF
jgi:hypothetical protein